MQPPNPGTEDLDDDHLVALARRARDDEDAFERLVRAVRGKVVGWAHRSTGDEDEAEDIAQLVLVRLQSRLRGYEARSRFTSWLFRLTRNVVLDRRRLARRRALLLELGTDDLRSEAENIPEGEGSAVGLEPLVRTFLDELTPRQQAVFEFVDLNHVSAAVAAERLGISPSTVRVLLMQARRTMRIRILERHPNLLEDYGR